MSSVGFFGSPGSDSLAISPWVIGLIALVLIILAVIVLVILARPTVCDDDDSSVTPSVADPESQNLGDDHEPNRPEADLETPLGPASTLVREAPQISSGQFANLPVDTRVQVLEEMSGRSINEMDQMTPAQFEQTLRSKSAIPTASVEVVAMTMLPPLDIAPLAPLSSLVVPNPLAPLSSLVVPNPLAPLSSLVVPNPLAPLPPLAPLTPLSSIMTPNPIGFGTSQSTTPYPSISSLGTSGRQFPESIPGTVDPRYVDSSFSDIQ